MQAPRPEGLDSDGGGRRVENLQPLSCRSRAGKTREGPKLNIEPRPLLMVLRTGQQRPVVALTSAALRLGHHCAGDTNHPGLNHLKESRWDRLTPGQLRLPLRCANLHDLPEQQAAEKKNS